MDEENWEKFIEEAKEKYKKIGYVECPAFSNERVCFTNVGFDHIIRKQRRMREKSVQIKRIALCQFSPGIIKRSKSFVTYFTNIDRKGVRIHFWSFEGRVNGMNLVVIIRQVDSNPKHFFSIFER